MVKTATQHVRASGEANSSFSRQDLERLNRAELALWSARCAVRVLPLLGITGTLPGWLKDRIRHMRAVEASAAAARTVLFSEAKNAAADARIAAAASSAAAAAAGRASLSPQVVSVSYAACAAGAVAATGNVSAAVACAAAAELATEVALPDSQADLVKAMRVDFEWLTESRARFEEGEHGLDHFYERPLWEGVGVPAGWGADAFEKWCVALVEVTLEPVFERYEKFVNGEYRRVDAAAAVNDWYWRHRAREKPPSLDELKAALVQALGELQEILDHGFTKQPEAAPETVAPQPPGVPVLLPDEPTRSDQLGRRPLAVALAAMLASPPQHTPFTIAVIGERGAGKTSLLSQVQAIIESENGPFANASRVVWVDAAQLGAGDRAVADMAAAVGAGLSGVGTSSRSLVASMKQWGILARFQLKTQGRNLLKGIVAAGFMTIASMSLYSAAADYGNARLPSWLMYGSLTDQLTAALIALATIFWLWIDSARRRPPFRRLPRGRKVNANTEELRERLQLLYRLQSKNQRLIVVFDGAEQLSREAAQQVVDASNRLLAIQGVASVIALSREQATRPDGELLASIDLPVGIPRIEPADQSDYVRRKLLPTSDEQFEETVESAPREQLDDDLATLLGPGGPLPEVSGEETKPDYVPSDMRTGLATGANGAQVSEMDLNKFAERYCDQEELTLRDNIDLSENEATLFDRLTDTFEISNPRRLVRLANAYRLFKANQLLQAEPDRPAPLDLGLALRAMIWLDRLSECDPVTRTAAVAWFWGCESPRDVQDTGLLAVLRQGSRFTGLMRSPFGVNASGEGVSTRERYSSIATLVADACYPHICWTPQTREASVAWLTSRESTT